MTEIGDALVDRKLVEHFAPDDRERARRAIAEIEVPRVRLDAIKLADGSVDALERYAMLARIDWRDVVASAENPRYMAAGSDALHQPGIEHTIARDRADFEAWVERPGPFSDV